MKLVAFLVLLFYWNMKHGVASEVDASSNPSTYYEQPGSIAARRNALDKGFIRLGRSKAITRVGRSDEDQARFGQHGDAFIRFGKRAPETAEEDVLELYPRYEVDEGGYSEDPAFFRIGRGSGHMRLGRSLGKYA